MLEHVLVEQEPIEALDMTELYLKVADASVQIAVNQIMTVIVQTYKLEPVGGRQIGQMKPVDPGVFKSRLTDPTRVPILFRVSEEQVFEWGKHRIQVGVHKHQIAYVVERFVSVEQVECRVVEVKVGEAFEIFQRVRMERILVELDAVKIVELQLESCRVKIKRVQIKLAVQHNNGLIGHERRLQGQTRQFQFQSGRFIQIELI